MAHFNLILIGSQHSTPNKKFFFFLLCMQISKHTWCDNKKKLYGERERVREKICYFIQPKQMQDNKGLYRPEFKGFCQG